VSDIAIPVHRNATVKKMVRKFTFAALAWVPCPFCLYSWSPYVLPLVFARQERLRSVHLTLRENHVIVACPLSRVAGLDGSVEVVGRLRAMVAYVSRHGRAAATAVTSVLSV